MKFRAVRPNALGTPDAIVVPLSSDGATPSGLPRAVKTVVDRIAKAETGAGRLYGVTTHHAHPRVIVVGIGRAAELDTERAHNYAASAIKSLWRSNIKKVAIFLPQGGIGEDRVAQAAVEGATYAMWRPEAHRTREIAAVTGFPVTRSTESIGGRRRSSSRVRCASGRHIA